jgi:CubicO group peptidase (beta-lactamase class C family)
MGITVVPLAGWLVGEVIRRVSGRTPGRFFADEIAGRLGLDFFIGLPASERNRVSRMVYRQPNVDYTTAPPESIPEELRELVAAWRDPNSLSNRAFAATDPAGIDFNSPEVQAAELPSFNGIGTARGLAHVRRSDRRGGRRAPVHPGNPRFGDQGGGQRDGPGDDGAKPVQLRLHAPHRDQPHDRPQLLRHTGRGGSLSFADPEHGIAFGYVMNHIIGGPDDARATFLADAVRASLA